MFRNCFADFYLRLKRYRAGSTSTHDFNEGQRFGFGHGSRQRWQGYKEPDARRLCAARRRVSQKIDYFSEEANLPLTVGLLVDTSGSQREVLDQERRARYTFLDQILRERADRAFVVQFDTGVKTFDALDAPS